MTRVAVITPFLNPPEPFFREAIASLKEQTFGDWELVLVDDGSTATGKAIAAEFCEAAPNRIRCYSHEGGRNRGLAASRNLALKHTRAEFIACLDADDVWYPDKLAAQVRALDAAPHVALVFGRTEFWHSWDTSSGSARSDRVEPLGVAAGELGRGEFLLRSLRGEVSVPSPSGVLVRAAALRAVGGFVEAVTGHYEDQALYAKLSLSGVISASTEVWYRYRVHPASITHGSTHHARRMARRQYLDWLRAYLRDGGVADPAISQALTIERLATLVPRGPGLMRALRRAVSAKAP